MTLPKTILILGGTAAAAYVGFRIGGSIGAAVGALIGSFVGALTAGFIKRLKVIVKPNGEVQIEYETWY
ncbi:MAG: hypothetical protein CL916_10780 [Deltaproteobacteria bacterium]|nr:hypothetical protein [Deltaproteobacteria bacterium]